MDDAILTASARGTIMKFFPDGENICNFLIRSPGRLTFVRIKYASRFHGTLPEIEAEYRELIDRLRSIPGSSLVIRELWIYSRYGTWKYFRIGDTGIEEISIDDMPVKNEGEVSVAAARKVTVSGVEIFQHRAGESSMTIDNPHFSGSDGLLR
jgi:hypothetical protein